MRLFEHSAITPTVPDCPAIASSSPQEPLRTCLILLGLEAILVPYFCILYLPSALQQGIFSALWDSVLKDFNLNAELTRKALEKVGNPNVLVNIVSRRVRQLNGAGSAPARPLIAETAGLGAADIALLEVAEGKLGWEMLENNDGEPISAE